MEIIYHCIENISIAFVSCIISILWFSSDIIETFAKITKTTSLFKIDKYYQRKVEYIDIIYTYPMFLYEYKQTLITKLLSCNICFTFWVTLVMSIILNLLFYKNTISDIFVFFPINYIFSLLLFLIIKGLLKWS